MVKRHFKKYPIFYTLLAFNVFWTIIRTTRWVELKPSLLVFIIKSQLIELFVVQAMIVGMIVIYKWSGKRSPVVSIFTVFFISIVSPSVLYMSAVLFKYLVWPEGNMDPISIKALKNTTYYNSIFFIAIGGIFFVTHFRMNYLRQRDIATQSKALAKDAQLKMLRYQINPHFLFNILNSLHALVDYNKEGAKKLVVHLSEYYRLILDKEVRKHSLEQEIAIVTKFLELQKIRFEENFTYTISYPDKVLMIELPIFTIQVLIENAIKYGRKNKDNKLEVNLSLTLIDNHLSIVVTNSGKLTKELVQNSTNTNGTGNGLDNIKQRLKLYYDNNFDFSLTENQGMVIAQIDINNIGNEENFYGNS